VDMLSSIGVVLAFIAICVGAVLKGAHLGGLVNPAAFMIVIVGTIASGLVQTPARAMSRALQMLGWVFKPPSSDVPELIGRIVEWSRTARRKGLLALEAEVSKESDPFIRRGLELVYDGAAPDVVRRVLEVEISAREAEDTSGAKVFEGLGIYAPTLGIIGAVLGLMAVMENLQSPEKLGPGIAAAFTATIYGIGIANLFMLPMASKLKQIIAKQTQAREMVVEGLASIAEGDNPRIIEAKLQGYLTDGERPESSGDDGDKA